MKDLKKGALISFKQNFTSWLFIIPSIILFSFFIWHPLLSGIRYSFFKMNGFKMIEFVGFDNYINVLSSSDFYNALNNTFSYAFWSIIIGYFAPIIIAIFLNELVHFKGVFRLGVYFPNIVPGLAAYLMWKMLMAPGEGGVFNTIIGWFGLGPFMWIQDPRYSIPLIIMTMTWKAFGGAVLIYMASLQSVDQNLYEAVAIDGGGIWTKIRHITIPKIMPLAKMMLILQFINVFKVMQEPLIMTDGGPLNSSMSLLLLTYKYAFKYNKIDMAATVGSLVGILLFVISFIYMKVTKNKEA
ncbi:carbohydrate ABC transporter permease [Vallitalea okinawensis]|uniref:carbohydrate ABC transporter permease n=1 Tax=Vallitalea okinawensis TaxID=2078660 RepID=UPI000CFD1837|nr:sugar ABC transporter permease [Vallitalea okinawensis]